MKRKEWLIKVKKAIIFGLGNWYRIYIDELRKMYDIIAVSSNNRNEAMEYSDYISADKISSLNFDYVIVCCNDAEIEITNQLVNVYNIPIEKIVLVNSLFKYNKTIFHAQINEDAIVVLLLKLIGKNLKEVTYLELGTNHPAKGNNTYSLYQMGGKGILVEPDRNLKNIINAVRPRDVLINKAISLDGEPKEFYVLNASAVNTLMYNAVADEYKEKMKDFGIKETYTVETITVNDCLEMLGNGLDVFSIDIEGMDYEVLNQMNFYKYRPKIIIAEMVALGVKEQQGDKIEKLLEKNGYFCFHNNSLNGIYVDEKYKELVKEYMVS